jgi:hypothetical protein
MTAGSFGTKAKAIALLRREFFVPAAEIKRSLLDLCVAAGGNQYDVAVQYVIARALSIRASNERVVQILLSDLHVADQMAAFCSAPQKMRQRIVDTRELRKNHLGRNPA